MIPPLVEVHRFRPVALVHQERRTGFLAPFVAVEGAVDPAAHSSQLSLRSGDTTFFATYAADRRTLSLGFTQPGVRRTFRSRRHGRLPAGPEAIALTLTGRWLTAWARPAADAPWTARCKVDVAVFVEVRDPRRLHGLEIAEPRGTTTWRGGTFGQLGLRDLHMVTHADGSAYVRDGRHWATATHAGPGFADAAHTGVWSWVPGTADLRHEASLWWTRGALVHGDHAVHLVRDGERWLALASTWGDFRRKRVAITLTATTDDLLHGEHVLEGCEMTLPQPRGPQVAVWDPHLVRIDDVWHLSWVTARKFFDFRPALGRAPRLEGPWELLGAADDRRATEGGVLLQTEDGWRLLASDGPDNPRGNRRRYPAWDLAMRPAGQLEAPYVSNIPWPNLVHTDHGWSMLTFDGTEYDARLPGYGTHGDVVVMCEKR